MPAAARRSARRIEVRLRLDVTRPHDPQLGCHGMETGIETHFWWQSLGDGMRDVFRVLKPGGRLVLIAEFYNGGRHARYAERLGNITGMAALDLTQHRALFTDAGFTDVRVVEDAPRGWISALGAKPKE